LVLVVLVGFQILAGVHQEAHQHSQQSTVLVAVKVALTQPRILQQEVLVVVVVRHTLQQLVRLATLVVILLLRVMLVGVMQHFWETHTLRVAVVVQAQ
jgi:hypothetical protein